jgi:hypothetical protein
LETRWPYDNVDYIAIPWPVDLTDHLPHHSHQFRRKGGGKEQCC